ncbi:stage II sporulation protein M [bacterium]|nr:stage II sporulation protein M [bacterium]
MDILSSSFSLLWDHVGLGGVAAVLFVAGLGTSAAVVRHDVRWLMAMPLWVVRRVMGFIAPSFPPVRVFLLIFLFNSVAIFFYMASGVLIVAPAAVAFLTGMNIGVIVLRSREIGLPAPTGEPREIPPWVGPCGMAVIALELPCFWMAMAMGIRMGQALSRNYTTARLAELFTPRAIAYACVIVPILCISALAETAAIRGQISAQHDE